MKRAPFIAAGAGLAAAATLGSISMSATPPTYVLVHGAFADGSCWRKIVPRLEKTGARVIVGDLPGTNSDPRPPGAITFDDYVTTVSGWVMKAGGPVVLVGHSMGGMVISQVAERHPDLIARTIYLSAYLPLNGQSLLALSQLDTESKLGGFLDVKQQDGYAVASDEGMRTAFFNGCSAEDTADGLRHNHKQPLQPFITAAQLSDAAFGKIPRSYIHTAQDLAVSPMLQRAMIAKTPVIRETTLDAGHASFFSHDAELAHALIEFAAA